MFFAVRRRAAAKKKKLKNLGKSKSTDTEEEEGDDDGDDGELYLTYSVLILPSTLFLVHIFLHLLIIFLRECSNKLVVKSRPGSSSKEFYNLLSSQRTCVM